MNNARTPSGVNAPVRANSKVPATADGKPATMEPKIISEMPLPMPRSEICSPSHTKNMVPATKEAAAMSLKPKPGIKIIGLPATCWLSMATAMPSP